MSQHRFGAVDAAAVFVGLALVAQLTSRPRDRRYYRELRRPGFAPPAWVFPVAWTALNALQLWADGRLLNGREIEGRRTLLGLRGANWLLYALFTPAFFRARSPVLGGAVAVAQTLTAFATIFRARRAAPGVAAALTPLAGWLTFASTLSGAIAAKNPDPVVNQVRRHFAPPPGVTLH